MRASEIAYALERPALRFIERFEQVHDNPRMLLESRAAQCDQMHDRKNFGLLEIALFLGAIIGEQADYLTAARKRGGGARRNHRIDLAIEQHGGETRVGTRLITQAGGELQLDLLGAAGLVHAGLQPLD